MVQERTRAARAAGGRRARPTARRRRTTRGGRDARRQQRAQPDHGGGVSARDERRESGRRARLRGADREGGGDGRRDRGARRAVHPAGAAARRPRGRRGSVGDGRGGRGDDAAAVAGAREGRGRSRSSSASAADVMVRGIAGELREALLNLVQNALDAMAGGGTLRIATHITSTEASVEVQRHRHRHDGGSARARLRAVLHHEGGERHRARPRRGVRHRAPPPRPRRDRVDARRGDDRAPCVSARVAPGSPTARRARVPARPPRRVLLVEDHVDSREFMQALLESDGHTVEAVRTVSGRTSAARRASVVRSTCSSPTSGCPTAAAGTSSRSAARCRPSLRIGVVTGWEPRNEQDPACDFILRKPVGATELLSQIAGEG